MDQIAEKKATSWPYLASDRPLAIAHRGSAAHAPENTMAAFAHAVELGYRYIETDVHTTVDGQLVAFHDETLDRATDSSGAIGAHEWSVVRRARIAGQYPIPLLEEVLGAWPDVFVNIDAKSDSAVAPLIEALRRTQALDRVCVGSFSDRRLRTVREALGPRLCTSAGPREVMQIRLASLGLARRRTAAACLQVPVRHRGLPVVDRLLVKSAHRLGLKVHVWTVNRRTEMERLLDLGVDGIITDETKLLKQVLEARGAW